MFETDEEALDFLRESLNNNPILKWTDEEITKIALRVSGSLIEYAKKHKEFIEQPLPKMSNTAMQSAKWTNIPVYKIIKGN